MKIKKYISLKIISLFALCLWAAPQKCQAINRFGKINSVVRSSYGRRLLCNMTVPNYAKQAIPHYSKTQKTYSKSNGVLYATLGIGAAAIGIYEATNNRDIVHINGKSYYLHQQSATTAGLVTVSVSCPPVGAVIGCAAVVVGGIILIDAAEKASRSKTLEASAFQIMREAKQNRIHEIIRVDGSKVGSGNHKLHAHFRNGSALYWDGRWRHGPKYRVNKATAVFLMSYGFSVPGYNCPFN